jgi:hypothetical protein
VLNNAIPVNEAQNKYAHDCRIVFHSILKYFTANGSMITDAKSHRKNARAMGEISV